MESAGEDVSFSSLNDQCDAGIDLVDASLQHADHAGGVLMIRRLSEDLMVCSDNRVRTDHYVEVSYFLFAPQDSVSHLPGFLRRQFFHDFRGMRARYGLFSFGGDHSKLHPCLF